MWGTGRAGRGHWRLSRREVLRGSLLLGGMLLVGCGGGRGASESAAGLVAWPDEDRWPDQFHRAGADVQAAYRYAVANPDVMRWFPCFCGCGSMGHRSNLDCYVREYRSDGSVALDAMSFG